MQRGCMSAQAGRKVDGSSQKSHRSACAKRNFPSLPISYGLFVRLETRCKWWEYAMSLEAMMVEDTCRKQRSANGSRTSFLPMLRDIKRIEVGIPSSDVAL